MTNAQTATLDTQEKKNRKTLTFRSFSNSKRGQPQNRKQIQNRRWY